MTQRIRPAQATPEPTVGLSEDDASLILRLIQRSPGALNFFEAARLHNRAIAGGDEVAVRETGDQVADALRTMWGAVETDRGRQPQSAILVFREKVQRDLRTDAWIISGAESDAFGSVEGDTFRGAQANHRERGYVVDRINRASDFDLLIEAATQHPDALRTIQLDSLRNSGMSVGEAHKAMGESRLEQVSSAIREIGRSL